MEEVVYIDWMTVGVVFGLMGKNPTKISRGKVS